MKPTMTTEIARAAATDAGLRHAVASGRPPTPWTREDYDTAAKEFRRICRLFKLAPFSLPQGTRVSAQPPASCEKEAQP